MNKVCNLVYSIADNIKKRKSSVFAAGVFRVRLATVRTGARRAAAVARLQRGWRGEPYWSYHTLSIGHQLYFNPREKDTRHRNAHLFGSRYTFIICSVVFCHLLTYPFVYTVNNFFFFVSFCFVHWSSGFHLIDLFLFQALHFQPFAR